VIASEPLAAEMTTLPHSSAASRAAGVPCAHRTTASQVAVALEGYTAQLIVVVFSLAVSVNSRVSMVSAVTDEMVTAGALGSKGGGGLGGGDGGGGDGGGGLGGGLGGGGGGGAALVVMLMYTIPPVFWHTPVDEPLAMSQTCPTTVPFCAIAATLYVVDGASPLRRTSRPLFRSTASVAHAMTLSAGTVAVELLKQSAASYPRADLELSAGKVTEFFSRT